MTDSKYISKLLEAERAAAPPSGSTEAGLQRLLGTMSTHAAPLPVAVGSLKLGLSGVAKWVGLGFAIGTLGAGVASYSSQFTTSNSVVARAAPARASANAVRAPGSSAVVSPLPLTSAIIEAAPVEAKRAAARAVSAPAVPSASPTFDEELRLIKAAQRELNAGRGHLARIWLEEHRQRFPGGVFSLEREGLLVQSRCSARPNPTLAREFASRHPDSPMLDQLLRRCGAASPHGEPDPASGSFVGGDK